MSTPDLSPTQPPMSNGADQQTAPPTDVSTSTAPSAPVRADSGDSQKKLGKWLTGKQEHYLKRELVAEQVKWEINELNSPTALRRFGAPFKSEFGEVSPLDSELPILRYIFVHHIRDFPFLDKAKEKEFWQDKLQVFLESFASKNISSSEDRLEETKRRKLALKCQKLVELMVVSGVKTSSGFEERIRFSEIELVNSNAIDTGMMHTIPEGHYINGWDVNVAAIKMQSARRNIRIHKHAEFIMRVRRKGEDERFVARRYGDYVRLHRALRLELPGKVLPSVPKKNKSDTQASSVFGSWSATNDDDDDASSVSSASTQHTALSSPGNNNNNNNNNNNGGESTLSPRISNHRRTGSSTSSSKPSPRLPQSATFQQQGGWLSPALGPGRLGWEKPAVLWRESQRISLRAFMRTLLGNAQVAQSKALEKFLTKEPFSPTEADLEDMARRKAADERRVEEQRQFYEVARQRAADLDVYMEQFRRDIVEKNGLTMLFNEIKEKPTIDDLSIQYRKFAEWLRIEVAATIYHLFLAEDNSPELFAQAKRIHSLIPYTVIKNVIRIANPAAVMSGILDIFLAQPWGARSLMQRIFSLTLNDGVRTLQRSIDALAETIGDPVLVRKLKDYTEAEDHVKQAIRAEAVDEDLDLVVAILRTELISPPLTGSQFETVFNAYVAFSNAVESVNMDAELKQGAQLFSHMKQLLKLCTRQRDKLMMLNLIEEPVTLQLFRDLFTIFYEPLVRVYKSANVYGSVTDFAGFVDDMIQVVERCRDEDATADPNQTVQAFIDLCARHEHNFYNFVHEVHSHDHGLFTQLMGWIEGILDFLRNGPANGTLDIHGVFERGLATGAVDKDKAMAEIDRLMAWQEARKKWHHDKTRQKMAADGGVVNGLMATASGLASSDFGLDQGDLEDMGLAGGESDDSELDELEAEDELDPLEAERRNRARRSQRLRRMAGEPEKPAIEEVHKLKEAFLAMLRVVLA